MNEFEKDAEDRTYSADQLTELAALAQAQVRLEDEIAEVEERLGGLTRARDRLSTIDIPNKMDEIGVQDFMLKTGERITIKRTTMAAIAKVNLDAAVEWLRCNGAGDLIKNIVSIQFGKGEDDRARDLVEKLSLQELWPDQKISVHPQTLSAYVREQLEKGNQIPMELLGVFERAQTKIVAPKR